MSPLVNENAALRALIAKWRETADIWASQLDDDPKGNHFPLRRDAENPPTSKRRDIQNWINWLRGCADEVEAALSSAASAKGEGR